MPLDPPNLEALVARAQLNALDPYDALVLRRLTTAPPQRPIIETTLEREPEDQKRWEAAQAAQRAAQEELKQQRAREMAEMLRRRQAAFGNAFHGQTSNSNGSWHFRSGPGTSNW